MLKRLALLVLPLVLLGGALLQPTSATSFPAGPDVSRWQHDNGRLIDWNAVRRSGQSFAFIKAAGLVRGAYHYADPSSPADAQAAFVVRTVGSTREASDLGIVLDLESTGGLSRRALVVWAHAFLAGVERRTGRTPLIYTYPSFWHSAMGDDRSFGAYPLWLYASRPPAPLPGWSQWTFWQYSSTSRLPGIPGYVDHNVMCCGTGTLMALADGRSRAIAALWRRLGGASGSLGLPLGTEEPVPGGWGQVFQRGYVATTRAGTFPVLGAVWNRYRITRSLGVPLSAASVSGGVTQQVFSGGRIVGSAATGMHSLRGAVLQRWLRDGGAGSAEGLPIAEPAGPGQQLLGGGLYVTAAGVRLVPGAIRDRYEALGGAGSVLGLPTSDAVVVGGLTTVTFQVGQLSEVVVAGQQVVV